MKIYIIIQYSYLAWLGSAQLEVLGDLLGDGSLLAEGLGHLLVSEAVRVSLGLALVVEVSVVDRPLELDLLAVGVLVAGHLDEGLGLGLALALHLDPAELLGDGLQLGGAGRVVAMVPVEVARGGGAGAR